MNRGIAYIALFIFVTCLTTSCVERDGLVMSPEIDLNLTPDTGNTTTIFTIDLNESFIDITENNQGFIKVDWDGDDIWDTPFMNKLTCSKRMLIPGEYVSRVLLIDFFGLTDTAYFDLLVKQGYSPPIPGFTVDPPTGNFFNIFKFDASESFDYEDSLSTLKFRWDFNNDNHFDTYYLDSAVTHHRFDAPDMYHVVLELTDPSGLVAKITNDLIVGVQDYSIKPDFTVYPDPVANVELTLDASLSIDNRFPDQALQYQWDWNLDGFYDTYWQDDPVITYVFKEERIYQIGLRVRNYIGLQNDTVKIVDVGHQNQPPNAVFITNREGGNVLSQFRFDVWGCRDLETRPSRLSVRWDWEGDGVWDTEPSLEKVYYKTFPNAGEYDVTVEITDEGGLKNLYSKKTYVSASNNETDILMDKRGNVGYQYYGITKIGSQWWFSKNLNLQDWNLYHQYYYNDDFDLSAHYGCLYSVTSTIICPDGWRIPTNEDWEELFSQYSSEELYHELSPQGSSGFSASFGGLSTSSSSRGLNSWGFYLSQTKLSNSSGLSYVIVSFDKEGQRVLKGYQSPSNKYSVRCIKN